MNDEIDDVMVPALPPELATLEQAGLGLEARRREREQSALAERAARKAAEIDAAWRLLWAAIQADIPLELLPLVPDKVPENFTPQALEWELEIPLPGGRPPLLARYQRYLAADNQTAWRRTNNGRWGIPSWEIEHFPDKSPVLSLRYTMMQHAPNLAGALALARYQARCRRKLEEVLEQVLAKEQAEAEQKQAEDKTRADLPPKLLSHHCTAQERAALDALRELYWAMS